MKFDDFFNDGNVTAFAVYVELQTTQPEPMSISQVFNINNSGISEFGRALLADDIPQGLKAVLSTMSWAIRTYICFQDIFDAKSSLDYNMKEENPEIFTLQLCDFNKNYCYFESLSYLKEAILCLLNGNLLATMVLLRPFLELSVANIYWALKSDKNSSAQFYKWLLGERRHKKTFATMIDYYFANCDALTLLNKEGLDKNKKCIKVLYDQLCSYNHTPFLEESIVSYSGNTGVKSHEFLAKLLALINDMLFHVNFIYLLNYPMALFPQDIYRHFGYFGGPVGLFFDEFNYAILERYFGREELLLLTKALEHYSIKKDLINFINVYSVNGEELEQSWQDFVRDVLKNNKYEELRDHAARVTLCKTHFRGFRLSTSYITNVDLTKINKTMEEGEAP